MLPNDYAEMTRADKITHWAGVIHRHMRWIGESGKDEMTVFDRELLEDLRSADAEIDALMPAILTYAARMWLEAPAAFVGAANAGMGTSYPVDEELAVARFGIRAG